MDYEKKYNDALNLAKSYYGKGSNEFLDTIFPELRESEDERIRKELIEFIKWSVDRHFMREDFHQAKRPSEWIAYLEKQKDASKAIEAVERIDKYIDRYLANAHDMDDSNPYKKYYRGWDDALGKMAGILQDVYSNEKQKEQTSDIILKAFENSKTDYSLEEREEASDYSEKVLPTSIACGESDEEFLLHKVIEAAYIAGQKEQKPKHFELKAGKWYICHRAFCCRADHLTVKEGERFMCEKDGIVKGFVIKEPEKYFKECSAPAPMEDEQKPAKWSEEDEKYLDYIIKYITHYDFNQDEMGTLEEYHKLHNGAITWLKSLRPSWKPSEEQMAALHTAAYLEEMQFYGGLKDKLRDLYEQLKKL